MIEARRLQRRAQTVQQAIARQLEDVQARLAGRGFQERPGLTAELDDVEVAIDDHAGRRVAFLDEARRLTVHRLGVAVWRNRAAGLRRISRAVVELKVNVMVQLAPALSVAVHVDADPKCVGGAA